MTDNANHPTECKRCFICWDDAAPSASPADQLITACECKDEKLRWAHVKCLDNWINQEADTSKCRVCNVEYMTETVRIPVLQVLASNWGLTLYLVFVGLVPLGIYIGLLCSSQINFAVSKVFFIVHSILMVIAYGMFISFIYSSFQWTTRRIASYQPVQNV